MITQSTRLYFETREQRSSARSWRLRTLQLSDTRLAAEVAVNGQRPTRQFFRGKIRERGRLARADLQQRDSCWCKFRRQHVQQAANYRQAVRAAVQRADRLE